jgi:hypothetical protein
MERKVTTIRDKKTGQRGTLLQTQGGREEVGFPTNGIRYRCWFSTDRVDFVPALTAAQGIGEESIVKPDKRKLWPFLGSTF